MITFSYLLGCRNCLNGSDHRHLYVLLNGNEREYQRLTEYDAMNKVENWRQEKNLTCDVCNSTNVEIMDIEVNDYPLYDFNRIARRCELSNKSESKDENMFMLNIDKRNLRLVHDTGGSPSFHKDFLQKCLSEMIDTVKNRPDTNFRVHQNGNFFMCFTGGFDFNQGKQIVKLEKFRNAGLSREEIIGVIKALAARKNITIIEQPKEEPKKKSWWNW